MSGKERDRSTALAKVGAREAGPVAQPLSGHGGAHAGETAAAAAAAAAARRVGARRLRSPLAPVPMPDIAGLCTRPRGLWARCGKAAVLPLRRREERGKADRFLRHGKKRRQARRRHPGPGPIRRGRLGRGGRGQRPRVPRRGLQRRHAVLVVRVWLLILAAPSPRTSPFAHAQCGRGSMCGVSPGSCRTYRRGCATPLSRRS